MKMKSISLAAALALASTAVLAQGGSPQQNPQAGGPASKATTGDDNGAAMKDGAARTTGSSRPSPKDASTQGGKLNCWNVCRQPRSVVGGTMKK